MQTPSLRGAMPSQLRQRSLTDFLTKKVEKSVRDNHTGPTAGAVGSNRPLKEVYLDRCKALAQKWGLEWTPNRIENQVRKGARGRTDKVNSQGFVQGRFPRPWTHFAQ